MSCHTTTPKILDMFILSLMLVPTKTHVTTSNLFLTFLPQHKSSCQKKFPFIYLIKFYFSYLQHPKIKIKNTFFSPPCFSYSLSFLFYHTTTFCLPSSSSFHLFASPKSLCQSPSRNLIHRFPKAFSLDYRYFILS
jgi:hypothetical protein